MKACPYCAESIQDAAIVCKHCGRSLTPAAPAVSAPAPKKKTGIGTKLVAALLGLLFIGWCSSLMTPTPPASVRPQSSSSAAPASPAPTTAPPAAPTPAPLQLLSLHGGISESESFNTIEGQVKNVSAGALKNVSVVATWYDKNDQFIKSDDALIEYNPILPGQTSPFKSITSRNPAMARYTVSFKFLFGRAIDFDDARKKTR